MQLMINCIKSTELIEKKNREGLSLPERLSLRFHTVMCDCCKEYIKQSVILEKILHRYVLTGQENYPMISNPQLKERILAGLGNG